MSGILTPSSGVVRVICLPLNLFGFWLDLKGIEPGAVSRLGYSLESEDTVSERAWGYDMMAHIYNRLDVLKRIILELMSEDNRERVEGKVIKVWHCLSDRQQGSSHQQ